MVEVKKEKKKKTSGDLDEQPKKKKKFQDKDFYQSDKQSIVPVNVYAV